MDNNLLTASTDYTSRKAHFRHHKTQSLLIFAKCSVHETPDHAILETSKNGKVKAPVNPALQPSVVLRKKKGFKLSPQNTLATWRTPKSTSRKIPIKKRNLKTKDIFPDFQIPDKKKQFESNKKTDPGGICDPPPENEDNKSAANLRLMSSKTKIMSSNMCTRSNKK